MYGLILAKDQNYREAEIFLKVVTDIYPRFVEGWVILHLLYIRMNYNPGITNTYNNIKKYLCYMKDIKYFSIFFYRNRSHFTNSGKMHER